MNQPSDTRSENCNCSSGALSLAVEATALPSSLAVEATALPISPFAGGSASGDKPPCLESGALPPGGDMAPLDSPAYFTAKAIAARVGLSKRQLHRRAIAEGWPRVPDGNRFKYQPPAEILELLARDALVCARDGRAPRVGFLDLTHDVRARRQVILRQTAVAFFRARIADGVTRSLAAEITVNHFLEQNFAFGPRTLMAWDAREAGAGINGLVPQKRGLASAGSIVAQLTEAERAEFLSRGKALALEFGHGGQSNVAAAVRELARDPDCPAALRDSVHECNSSKSYVPPSLRDELTPAPLTARMAQVGTRHARRTSRSTIADWSAVRAGDVFCADDMTDNVISWTEWPNERGYRVGQAQMLMMIDCGSFSAIEFRLLLRESGLYTSDDVAGLFGQTFEKWGKPAKGFILERGIWESNATKGHRTGIAGDERLGGLESLGLKVWHVHTPGAKPIESFFARSQASMDMVPGFIGREQRYDRNETIAKQLNEVKTGRAHPREYFSHLKDRADAIADAVQKLNWERNDGKITRGLSGKEKWLEDAPQLQSLGAEQLWLWRSAKNVVRVGRNGIVVKQGSGKKTIPYLYDDPLLNKFEGRTVRIFWDHYAPQTDAIIFENTARGKFVCAAKNYPVLDRFNATTEQLANEAKRQSAAQQYSRAELRSVEPYLQRQRKPAATDAQAVEIAAHAKAATAKRETKERAQAAARREVARTEVPVEIIESVGRIAAPDANEQDDHELLERLSKAEG